MGFHFCQKTVLSFSFDFFELYKLFHICKYTTGTISAQILKHSKHLTLPASISYNLSLIMTRKEHEEYRLPPEALGGWSAEDIKRGFREPLDLRMHDGNACVTCCVANLLYMFGKTENPALSEIDKKIGRAPGELYGGNETVFLGKQGFQMKLKSPEGGVKGETKQNLFVKGLPEFGDIIDFLDEGYVVSLSRKSSEDANHNMLVYEQEGDAHLKTYDPHMYEDESCVGKWIHKSFKNFWYPEDGILGVKADLPKSVKAKTDRAVS